MMEAQRKKLKAQRLMSRGEKGQREEVEGTEVEKQGGEVSEGDK